MLNAVQKTILALSLLSSTVCFGQNIKFTISGKLPENVQSKTLYFYGDSVNLLLNKSFRYQGEAKKPGLYQITDGGTATIAQFGATKEISNLPSANM